MMLGLLLAPAARGEGTSQGLLPGDSLACEALALSAVHEIQPVLHAAGPGYARIPSVRIRLIKLLSSPEHSPVEKLATALHVKEETIQRILRAEIVAPQSIRNINAKIDRMLANQPILRVTAQQEAALAIVEKRVRGVQKGLLAAKIFLPDAMVIQLAELRVITLDNMEDILRRKRLPDSLLSLAPEIQVIVQQMNAEFDLPNFPSGAGKLRYERFLPSPLAETSA